MVHRAYAFEFIKILSVTRGHIPRMVYKTLHKTHYITKIWGTTMSKSQIS